MPITPRDNVKEITWLAWLTMPLRIALWIVTMAMMYPMAMLAALFFAIYFRITRGTADVILRHSLGAAFKTGGTYACM